MSRSHSADFAKSKFSSLFAAAFLMAVFGASSPSGGQSLSFQRDRAREMLKMIRVDLEKNYYDPKFHGANLESVFKEADEIIRKADSHGQMYGAIARALLQLNDSHTYFIAPSRVARTEYGWVIQSIGNECFITAVQPGSNAAAKGVKSGDLVLSIDGMTPTRDNLSNIHYLYFLRPQATTHFVLRTSNQPPRELDVDAKVTTGKKITDLTDYNEFMKLVMEEEKDNRLRRHRTIELGGVFIWKMPAFDLSPERVDDVMKKIRKNDALILDLRSNGGGAEETLLRMIGNLFDHDVTIGELSRRKERRPLIAKTRGADAFKGKVIVLLDSGSASSSELFARVIQLEKRGTVIGDRSAGAVMRARYYPHEVGVDTVAYFGVSITDADLIMSDGKSLEGLGVNPDELILPLSTDLAAGRDPVLTRAAAIAGLSLDPIKAGLMFPTEWRQ
jgi:carboxyl-terminal processing protease